MPVIGQISPYVLPGIRYPSPLDVIGYVCSKRNVTHDQLKNQYRGRRLALARQECMYLIRKHCKDVSFKCIGNLLCRDHTTVMHAVKSIQDYIDTTPEYRKEINQLSQSLINPTV